MSQSQSKTIIDSKLCGCFSEGQILMGIIAISPDFIGVNYFLQLGYGSLSSLEGIDGCILHLIFVSTTLMCTAMWTCGQ